MPRAGDVISHWHHSVENFSASALEFYQSLEEALRAKEAPGVKTQRVDWAESGLLSAKREYLRVSYSRYSFDICAAPFGKDFFFSWWLTKRRPESALMIGCGAMIGLLVLLMVFVKVAGAVGGFLLFLVALGIAWGALANGAFAGAEIVEDVILALPIWGPLYARYVKPVTYFSEDSRLIFEEAVHRVALKHVEALLTLKQLPPLTAEEQKLQTRKIVS